MKTPEEIKRGLLESVCDANYALTRKGNDELVRVLSATVKNISEGYAYIEQLEQDNAQKDERIRELEREKEAMLRDMKAWPACDACKHRNLLCTQKPCSECLEAGNGKTVMWEWRGVEEDEA